MRETKRQGSATAKASESGSLSLKSQPLKTLLTSEANKAWELKHRIREAQRRLKFIEDKLEKTNGDEFGRWQEAYPKVLQKMESLCSELQDLVSWENTCPWGCEACLNLDKLPLIVFEEQGYLLLWSDMLKGKIAFAKEWAKDKVPKGYVIYSEDELKKLFSDSNLKKQTLRLVHEAKKRGAIVTKVKD